MNTYTILDVERKQLIGFVVASCQRDAMKIAREEFNSTPWNERFPFEAEFGRELAIRPDYDVDPYFTDHDATTISHPQTYSRPAEHEVQIVNIGNGEHLI